MSGDLVLAVVGLSAGVGSAVGAWAALWWRDRVPFGQRQLVRWVFIHVDQLIGATDTENQLRGGKRFQVQRWLGRGTTKKGNKKLGTAIADWFWPVPPSAGGATVRPSIKRMGAYVQLEFRWHRSWWAFWWRPYRIWDIEAVIVHWTSESNPLRSESPHNWGIKVAQSLRLASADQLDVHRDTDRGTIRYSRKQAPREMPTTMPHEVTVDA